MINFSKLKKESLKHTARLALACLCFNALTLKAEEDYSKWIYEFLTTTLGDEQASYKSFVTMLDSWYMWSSERNFLQKLNTPTALFTVFDETGSRAYDVSLTYAEYLDYFKVNNDLVGWTIRPNANNISEFHYISNYYYSVANISKGNFGGVGPIAVTNKFDLTIDDFEKVVPVTGSPAIKWNEWMWSLLNGTYLDDDTRWDAYRKLKASRELQENLDMLTGGGIIGRWRGGYYGSEEWNDTKEGLGYEVQELLKNKGGGSGAALIEPILNDENLSPTEKANLINNAVQAGQRNLLNDLNEKIKQILEDGIRVNNTNEFPSGEGGGGGIALPSEFINALTNLSKDVSNINTQQNERVDSYATLWRGNLGLLTDVATTTQQEIQEGYKEQLNNISNSLATSKTLLESLFKNDKLENLESGLNVMIENLAVYECPQTIVIYKLDNIANWLYQQGLFTIASSIQGKNIEINLDSEIELNNGSLSWRDVCRVFRVIFILFYVLSGLYVFYRFGIFLADSIMKIISFVLRGFSNLVKLLK